MITTLQLVTQNTTVSNRQRLTLLNSLPSAGHVIATASAFAASASVSASASEAARDAALLSRGVFSTTAKALSKGVVSTTGLVGGSGGTNGTFALAFSGGAGSGAAGVFTVAGGAVTSITITASGDSYTSAPTISFSASSGLTGASATAVIADNVSAGEWFSVPVSGTNDALILYENVAGTATERVRYPSNAITSQTVNKGKGFPFKQMTRWNGSAAITSPASTDLNNIFIDLYVLNADPTKYYRVAFMQNEALFTDTDFGWALEEVNVAGYSTSDGVATSIHGHGDPAPTIDRNGGIQTIVITPVQRPNLRFVMTIDASALPPAGTWRRWQISGEAGYSWVIDPSRCLKSDWHGATAETDSVKINKGKAFPFKSLARWNGTSAVTSAASTDLNDIFLDIAVLNSDPTKYYKVSYMQNEASIGGDTDFGWTLEEINVAGYSTSDGVATQIHGHGDPAPTINRSGGIQTIVITPAQRPNLRFVMTIDAASLPAAGTSKRWQISGDPAYSWVIDPSRYRPLVEAFVALPHLAGVYYTYDHALGKISYAYLSGDSYYRVHFGINGYNGLPNLFGADKAPANVAIDQAVWTVLSSTGTDYLPPMVFSAQAGGDGGTQIYTGGNHGADGTDGGGQTARCALFKVFADGKLLTQTTTGYAEHLSAIVVNELMAYNTITFPRYPIRQTFGIHFTAGAMEVHCEVYANEAVTVNTDNGPQHYFGGFAGTMLFLEGANTARATLDSSVSSGIKSSYPNVWAIVTKESGNGQMVSWVDRSYEAGDGRYVAASAHYIRGGGGAKFYHAIVAASATPMSSGQSYKWRGGFAFGADSAATGFDSSFSITNDRKQQLVYVYDNGKSVKI